MDGRNRGENVEPKILLAINNSMDARDDKLITAFNGAIERNTTEVKTYIDLSLQATKNDVVRHESLIGKLTDRVSGMGVKIAGFITLGAAIGATGSWLLTRYLAG